MFQLLKERFAANRTRNRANRRSIRLSEDEALIAQHAPEVSGMGFVNGGAFVLSAINEWRSAATPDQLAEFAGRLEALQTAWENEGLTMPWWGNLKELRDYQAELDPLQHAPIVAVSRALLGRQERTLAQSGCSWSYQ